jgi:hypothetical protein
MARKVIVTLVDDYDGTSRAEETVVFGLDGVTYEMDLSVLNGRQLRGLFEQWTPHARKVGRGPRSKTINSKPSSGRDKTTEIREWARDNGHKVSSRGRVPSEVVAAYENATT